MNAETKIVYRITYTKGDGVKYISHLDFLRCVNRAFKRAKLPVKYSQGFNPHILQNIALPCPVGVSSECEMLDIEMTRELGEEELCKSLDAAMPDGIKILKAERRTNHPDFFAIESAKYSIDFSSNKDIDTESFDSLDCYMIEKKSKRGMKEVNIKDFVRSMKTSKTDNGTYHIDAVINAGSQSNLKTELLMSAMAEYYGAFFSDVKTVRKEIYFAK
ncbi:MAG: DUF2344 domain-containing protein [Ruminococcaceae bacterium]|nr:DUF2344 domain-containing protein [Oscillospiraceae bacterium]